MDQLSPSPETPPNLPNPRGGAVPGCETALAQALDALRHGTDVAAPLRQAHEILRAAGWIGALRFAEALLAALPYVGSPGAGPTLGVPATGTTLNPLINTEAGAADTHRQAFSAALRAFRGAVAQRDLHELACSPRLFAHYCALQALLGGHAGSPGRAPAVALDELALAGRPVPPATLRPGSGNQPFQTLRARYERALLPVLREAAGAAEHPDSSASSARAALDDCLAQLAQEGQAAGGDPYDFWRLALASLHALQQTREPAAQAEHAADRAMSKLTAGQSQASVEAQYFYAHFNLVLAAQARGSARAPAALVRAVLAVLWREYVLQGGSAGNLEQVGLLRDYGLSVAWHASSGPSTAPLWEAQAPDVAWEALATDLARPGQGAPAVAPPATRATRDIGPLRVDASAFEDFLQTADAAIAALSVYATAPSRPSAWDAGAALQAADAAYRLADCAWVRGLGGVALLADALGLAWRRLAHAAARPGLALPADIHALENGAYALRGMLHQIAAGMAPADAGERLAELTAFIETDFPR